MKGINLLLVFVLSLVSMNYSLMAQDVYDLYILAGQSNMDGYGYVRELPDSLNKEFKNVFIFHGNTVADDALGGGEGSWSKLKPGHGVGFAATKTANTYSDRFGLEMSFAAKAQEVYPDRKIAIIKYSRGGTSLDSLASEFGSWDPDYQGVNGINQYDNFLATMKNALTIRDVDGDGHVDQLNPKGIVWMQGESDGNIRSSAEGYEANLKRLMYLMRATLWSDDLPVVIGKISDSGNEKYKGKVWKYGELVQFGQEEFVHKDENAAIIRKTKMYGYSDPWHYRSEDYIDLGLEFFKAIDSFLVE
ncbi:MAG: sialate O-acetylesterase [Reichenbachiella sp.]